MRTSHYLAIAVAVGAALFLYFGGKTIPPASVPANGDETGGMSVHNHIHTEISVDSLRNQAFRTLSAAASDTLGTLERAVTAISDSAQMADALKQLAAAWQQHEHPLLAAWYYAEAAKLENSEKSLNFAGRFFLQVLPKAGSHDLQDWAARQAIGCLERSLEINPANDTTKLTLAAAYIEGAGETMTGVQVLLGITREDPQHAAANLMLGRLAVQSGQFDKAIQRFETVTSGDPQNTEALYFMAEAYKGMGDKKKAIALFEQCKKIVNKPEFTRDIDQYINSFK